MDCNVEVESSDSAHADTMSTSVRHVNPFHSPRDQASAALNLPKLKFNALECGYRGISYF